MLSTLAFPLRNEQRGKTRLKGLPVDFDSLSDTLWVGQLGTYGCNDKCLSAYVTGLISSDI